MSTPHSASIFVAPESMSARYRVHSPAALRPLKLVSEVERAEISVTFAGSAVRPSGSQMPVSGEPSNGVSTF